MRMAILLAAAVAIGCGSEQRDAGIPAAAPADTVSVSTAASTSTAVEHTIDVAGTFSPAAITIPPNTPARLHFRRGSDPTCADEIVFPDLGIRKTLAANETVTVEIAAQQARTLSFACGMNMMKGSLVVQ